MTYELSHCIDFVASVVITIGGTFLICCLI